ncbi:acyl dehydratase [Rubricella aquisinus]|uniref:Acyl dehydratase n=1 Tax=Rubricella aquisinus TaxID=2028108 RepID=A0A840WIM3_9RHOB|nr:MaoC family dehydratase [Rubricella aquisinus]MBB5514968.1 acyl dehydratase [Rubricella aquisinus]
MTYRHHIPLEAFADLVGQEVGVSRWFTLDQPMIDHFADLTEDRQFIHTDPDKAAKTPFGGTVAHGFLTLSLLSAMAYDCVPVPIGMTHGVNYGFDKLRFLSPVPSGAQLRGRFTLAQSSFAEGALTLHHDVTMDCDASPRPALAARWIIRVYVPSP